MNYTEARKLVLDEMLRLGPDHFDMDAWFSLEHGEENIELVDVPVHYKEIDKCGTTACWAGTAVSAVARFDYKMIDEIATCDEDAFETSFAKWMNVPEKFFYVRNWPIEMREFMNRTMHETLCSRLEAEWATVVAWLRGELPGECYPELNPAIR